MIDAGIARVVAAMQDPNPLVAGQGAQQLEAAHIAVDIGLMEASARALNPGFTQRMQHGRPYVRLKLAVSLDGRSALAHGASKWISGEAARQDAQCWRARSSAILTGIGTVLADDPSLTVRAFDLAGRQPLRVVVDSELRLPVHAKLLALPGATLVATANNNADRAAALSAAGAALVAVRGADGRVDRRRYWRSWRAARSTNCWSRPACLSGAMLHAGLVDELIVYLAPHVLGAGARDMFDIPVLTQMSARVSLAISDVRAVGSDWRIIAKPVKSEK